MAIHLEFVVLGPPISNQQSTPNGRANLLAWRAAVAGAATPRWPTPLLLGDLKAIIINFYASIEPSVDVDNLAKPILDVMQNIVYADDRQIVQAEIIHAKIGAASQDWGRPPDHCDRTPGWKSVRLRADRRPSRSVPTTKVMP